ncbi:MAG: DNA polymerase III subunit alpha [Eubacteriales bacterium]|nr:DNA polymerase III subunit alpha [Eubacteriales bacterium]
MSFTHLHVHTEYSLLDGSNKISEYVSRVKELGMTAAAITDHGVMYGVIDFYKACKKEGINPVIGCEVYVAPGSRFDREASHGDDRYYHLILLAENNTGYANLMKIVSRSFTEGFYYKPRVDLELLREFHEGIIASSACLAGEVAREITRGNAQGAREAAKRYLDIFGEGYFFLELQDHGYPEQQTVNAELLKMSREMGIPLIATNDCHYTYAEDEEAHDILLCVQTGKKLSDENRMRYPGGQFYVKSEEEMRQRFPYAQTALENTQRIADRCHVEIEFGVTKLPKFDVPEGYDSWTYLNKLCEEGMDRRYPGWRGAEKAGASRKGRDAETAEAAAAQHNGNAEPAAVQAEGLRARLEYELNTIRQMGYVDYFLIVWDYINYARENGIMVGPGRGSAAGSIVSYSLGITDIDPIRYNLLFERFLNPERVSMPDIDVDFGFERRGEVIDYVTRKYGKDRVMQIITFGTMAARGVIRDVGRVMDLPYGFVDSIAKMVPQELNITLEKALKQSPDLRGSYENDERVKKLIDMSLRLEGLPRHASVHAAGVVICSEPAEDLVPLARAQDGSTTTQFPMTTIEELGLLKMDFLGLRTLTVIQNAVGMANRSIEQAGGAYPSFEPAVGSAAGAGRPAVNPVGPVVSMDLLDYADPAVYRYISTGRTDGIFQLESGGMQSFMKELQPESFEDVIAGISLYRPGPMEFIPQYIRGKNNRGAVRYPCPELEPILEPTYGCIVYQEQVMQIVRDLGGYTLGRSDLVRRAMSKKKQSVMEQERRNFVYGNAEEHVPGCVARGIDEKVASGIYDTMMDFAKYAFNKSHAACYAVVAYQTAWLKYYYPMEFMAALMTSVIDHPSKVASYILACRAMKIRILAPDINEGEAGFSVSPDGIHYALTAIKGVGRPVIEAILAERRRRGSFRDLKDFLTRMAGQEKDVNRRTVESFIKAGALDCLGATRKQMMSVYMRILDDLQSSRKHDMAGQMTLFDIADEEDKKDYEIRMPDIGEYPDELRLSFEKEVLGIYVSGHPLEAYEGLWRSRVTATAADFAYDEDSAASGEDSASPMASGSPGSAGPAKGASPSAGNYTNARLRDRQSAVIGGILTDNKIKDTKHDQVMAFLTIEDMTGTVEVIAFPRVYEESAHALNEDARVFIRGRVSLEEEKDGKLIADEIIPFDDVPRRLWLRFPDLGAWKAAKSRVLSVVAAHGGRDQVIIYLEDRKARKTLPPGQGIRADETVLGQFREILGPRNVALQ